MASADLQDDTTCPMCMRFYTHPVLLPCGHNLCLSCLERALNTQEECGSLSCPQCRKELLECPNFSKGSTCDNHTRYLSSLAEMLCDPSHLQENRTCPLHKRPIESYCMEDAACLCASCSLSEKHNGHRVVTLQKASEEKKKLVHFLQDMNAERLRFPEESFLEMVKAQEKAIYEEERVEDLFRVIRRQLEELEKTFHGGISRRKEQLSLLQRTQVTEAELARKTRHIEELCYMTDPLTFLQELDKHGRTFRKLKDRREDYEQLHDLVPPDKGFISPLFREHLSSIVTGLKEIQIKFPYNYGRQTDVKCSPMRNRESSGSASVETVTSGNTKIYRLGLTSAGRYQCPETGIQFDVKGPEILEYSVEPWSNHMTDTQRNGYEIVGPLLNIITKEGHNNVSAVYLPHYLSPQCCDQYKSYIKFVHFKQNKMILESPTRIDRSYVVLENPTFSFLGVLLEKFWTFITRPLTFNGVVLIYGKIDKTYSFRLYAMIDNEPKLKSAIDKDIGKEFHFIDKPPQTNSVRVMEKYIVRGPRGAEIEPKFVRFRFTCPSRLYPYTEITLKDINKKFCLNIAEKISGNVIWSCSLKKEYLDNLRRIAIKSATSGRSQQPISEAKLFVQKNYAQLCKRLGLLSPILLSLRDKGVINELEEEEIRGQRTPHENNRILLNMVKKKGAEEIFCEALRENNRPLVEDLEHLLSGLQIK